MLTRVGALLAVAACTPPEDPRESHRWPGGDEPATWVPPEPAPTTPEPTIPPEPPDPGEWLLETEEVREIHLTVRPPELASLATAPEAWVPADLELDGVVLEQIGVRIKGNGSFQPILEKPSWKLSLDRYVPDQELDGLDDLVLNNMVTDPSYVRERLAYTVYRELGIPAPRATYAELVVNGAPYGLYLLLEGVDGRFLERWYDDAEGPLYEMFDVDLTPSEVWQFEHETGPDDRTALVGLADVLARPEQRVSVEGDAFLDVDQFAAYFGASAVIGQFDAYPYSVPGDDVYLYVDPADGRIDFLAHGADESFTDAFRPADYVFGLLAIRCLADVSCEERWNDAVWASLDAADALDLVARVDAWAELVRDQVPDVDRPAVEPVREFVTDRRARLEAMPGLE